MGTLWAQSVGWTAAGRCPGPAIEEIWTALVAQVSPALPDPQEDGDYRLVVCSKGFLQGGDEASFPHQTQAASWAASPHSPCTTRYSHRPGLL